MKIIDLKQKVSELARAQGIDEYEVAGIKLGATNFEVTSDGELVSDMAIDVRIIPKSMNMKIPITFTIKRED